jgi:hypothetical protein
MSTYVSRRRLLWLAPIVVAGAVSILASSSFEDNQNETPAEVDYTLASLPAPLVRDRGDRTVTITNLRLAGTYDASAGDDLTLDRDDFPLDSTSGFDLEVVASNPDDDDSLSGTVTMQVLSTIDFGLDHDPQSGQFSSVADGTTTLVTAQTDPGGVMVETGGADGQFFEWGEFRDAADDKDKSDDLRLASEAFNTISDVVRLALLAERVVAETELNRDTLENVGLDEPIDIACDNASGESVLIWSTDAPGSGEGELDEGDSVEARFESCFDTTANRYFEGTIVIDDYTPSRGDPPRTLSGDIDFGTLFIAEDPVTISTVPDPTSPRVDGGLGLTYQETVLSDTSP